MKLIVGDGCICCLIHIFVIVLSSAQEDGLASVLHSYELLDISRVRILTKREADPHTTSDYHQIWLSTHNRRFHLKMQRSKVLSHDFKTTVVHGDGSTSHFKRHHGSQDFYTGVLSDDRYSKVNVYWEEGTLTASIVTSEDVYFIEPALRYLNTSEKSSHISYKHSDMKGATPRKVCGSSEHDILFSSSINDSINDKEYTYHSRQKREDIPDFGKNKLCQIIGVADHYFFTKVGKKSFLSTQNYIIGVIDRVNEMYKSVKWPDNSSPLTGLGFEISDIIIHDEPTDSRAHYNMDDRTMDIYSLLTYLGKGFYRNRACLVHLFTDTAFSSGLLGLANIASWRTTDYGGICTFMRTTESGNVALTTTSNKYGKRVLTLQSSITTAHGHNWGAEHDNPDDELCSPSEFDGGPYLMYPVSQTGYSDNNMLFSPCSRRQIYDVLVSKGRNCLKAPNPYLEICGNGRVEGSEQCDPGGRVDPCCDEYCQFTSGADCSPFNLACCVNCRLANSTSVCIQGMDDNFDCHYDAHCNGYQYSCPKPESKPEGTPCLDDGVCKNGVCEEFCAQKQMIPCVCSKESGYACHRCCRKKEKNSKCVFFSELLENGRNCYQGYCTDGVCVRQPSAAVKFWSHITDRIFNAFEEFMKDNIVFFTTLFCSILWLIGIFILKSVDHRREKKDKPLRDRRNEKYEKSITVEGHDTGIKPIKLPLDSKEQFPHRNESHNSVKKEFSPQSYSSRNYLSHLTSPPQVWPLTNNVNRNSSLPGADDATWPRYGSDPRSKYQTNESATTQNQRELNRIAYLSSHSLPATQEIRDLNDPFLGQQGMYTSSTQDLRERKGHGNHPVSDHHPRESYQGNHLYSDQDSAYRHLYHNRNSGFSEQEIDERRNNSYGQYYNNPDGQYNNPAEQYNNLDERYNNPDERYRYNNPDERYRYNNPDGRYNNPDECYNYFDDQYYNNPDGRDYNPEERYYNPDERRNYSDDQYYPDGRNFNPDQLQDNVDGRYYYPDRQHYNPDGQHGNLDGRNYNPEVSQGQDGYQNPSYLHSDEDSFDPVRDSFL